MILLSILQGQVLQCLVLPVGYDSFTKPDLVVFLDTDPEIVRERKQELSFTEIGRQNNEYLKLLEKISSEVLILDGNYDVEIVLNQLWLHFLDNYMIKCNE